VLDLAAREVKDFNQEATIKYISVLEYLSKSIFKQIIEDKTEQLCEAFIKKKKAERKMYYKNKQTIRTLLFKEISELKKQLKKKNKELLEMSGLMIKALIESVQLKYKNKNEDLLQHDIITTDNLKSQGILRVSKIFIKMLMGKATYKGNNVNYLYLERVLPMICPPIKWVDWETGGYLHKGFSIMRTQGSRLQKASLERAELSKICEVLNVMGKTAWRINQEVLSIVESVYTLGGGLGEIPVVDRGDKFLPNESSSYFERQKLTQKKRENWSLLSDFELKLGIARKFKEIKRFYIPLNLDFRGRIYPISPHLNQIGNDLSRGLMEFANGKPLGKNGFYWLKIHLANKMGFDKLPIPDRLKIVEDMIPKIKNMAENPVEIRDWLEFEDPWQSLATIFELCKAIDSPNPEEYISHLHIHQDGSCNGLQHYAALGRDIEGAEQVNFS
jgi:DNA-directed RNA polymerase, mitochondrial